MVKGYPHKITADKQGASIRKAPVGLGINSHLSQGVGQRGGRNDVLGLSLWDQPPGIPQKLNPPDAMALYHSRLLHPNSAQNGNSSN